MERPAPPQTSGMRDVLSLSAMMIPFERASNVRPTVLRIISRFASSLFQTEALPYASRLCQPHQLRGILKSSPTVRYGLCKRSFVFLSGETIPHEALFISVRRRHF